MMTPAAFRDLVVKRRDACVKFTQGQPARDRRMALKFYRGDNLSDYGDSGDGLSTVVSRDTMEAIESMMPSMLRPFVAGEEVVSFDPFEKGDTESCAQATDYVNHVFRRFNNVLSVAQTGLKDGLLFRLGVAKTVLEEVEEGGPEAYEGLTEEEMTALLVERDPVGDIMFDPELATFGVSVAPRKVKKYRVHIIAPDEFLYEERLTSLDDATLLGHHKRETVGDLIAMGLPRDKVMALQSGDTESDDEREDRFRDEDETENWADDDLARPVWVDELYIRCDYSETGTLEWRKVIVAGSQSSVLLNEPAEDHPYSTWTPIPVPHKLVGMSMYDLTRDVQMQKTALQREANNAVYLANRPQRAVLLDQVNVEDLLNPVVGGVVRVKEKGAIEPIASGGEGVANQSYAMIEYLDGVREARTGVTRYNQGMDSNSLNKTATGINIIASNSQQRQELVARQFGEFLKDIFDKILALVAVHADPADVERLRDKPFVPWPTTYDMNVSVGLGTNNKDQMVNHLMALSGIMEKVITLQGGVQGPLVGLQNVYELVKRFPEGMGLKGDFFMPPPAEGEGQPQQPEQPQDDPLAEAKIKAQADIEKARIQAAADIEIERMKLEAVAAQNVVPFPVAA